MDIHLLIIIFDLLDAFILLPLLNIVEINFSLEQSLPFSLAILVGRNDTNCLICPLNLSSTLEMLFFMSMFSPSPLILLMLPVLHLPALLIFLHIVHHLLFLLILHLHLFLLLFLLILHLPLFLFLLLFHLLFLPLLLLLVMFQLLYHHLLLHIPPIFLHLFLLLESPLECHIHLLIWKTISVLPLYLLLLTCPPQNCTCMSLRLSTGCFQTFLAGGHAKGVSSIRG